jgi:F-type H+-transporting ATPase subunit b
MPQFDPSSFASQLFWLAVTFVLLYIVVSRFAVPRIGDVLDQRQKMVDDDLDRAQQLKAETEEAIAAYEKALGEARAKAHDVLRHAQDAAARKAAARHAEVNAKLAEQIKLGEARIAQARDDALAQVKEIASGSATAIASRLVGLSVDDAAVDAAVADVMKEKAR